MKQNYSRLTRKDVRMVAFQIAKNNIRKGVILNYGPVSLYNILHCYRKQVWIPDISD